MLAALSAHPRIGERPAGRGADAAASRREQAGVGDDAVLGLNLAEGNQAYEERFGHVYLVRASGRSGEELLGLLRARLDNDEATEHDVVRRELAEITSLRLLAPVGAGGRAVTLSTHVLDAAAGRPAAGVAVRLLSRRADGSWAPAGAGQTDGDGRLRDWLPPGSPDAGRHRLVFDTGAYFAAAGVPTFFPEVSVDFEITAPDEHHHVPLLLSPFAYSTYRGS